MKITFPHMGNTFIGIKSLLDELGLESVIPPQNGLGMQERVSQLAPESICYPYKLILANLMYGLEQGADVVMFGGSGGQCRQEYYSDMLCAALREMGYEFKYIHINLSDIWSKENLIKLREAVGAVNILKAARCVISAASVIYDADRLFAEARYMRPREQEAGTADKIIDGLIKEIYETHGSRVIRRRVSRARKDISRIPQRRGIAPLRVAIVGEIYIASEPYANMETERRLGALGVEVHNYLGSGMWIKEHMNIFNSGDKEHPADKAREFIKSGDIGGHGLETIGNTIISAANGFDGVIQLYPLSCMPEIIAQCSMGDITERYGIPVMTLVLDEMSGEAGYVTRLEAFVDMLKRRGRERRGLG